MFLRDFFQALFCPIPSLRTTLVYSSHSMKLWSLFFTSCLIIYNHLALLHFTFTVLSLSNYKLRLRWAKLSNNLNYLLLQENVQSVFPTLALHGDRLCCSMVFYQNASIPFHKKRFNPMSFSSKWFSVLYPSVFQFLTDPTTDKWTKLR